MAYKSKFQVQDPSTIRAEPDNYQQYIIRHFYQIMQLGPESVMFSPDNRLFESFALKRLRIAVKTLEADLTPILQDDYAKRMKPIKDKLKGGLLKKGESGRDEYLDLLIDWYAELVRVALPKLNMLPPEEVSIDFE